MHNFPIVACLIVVFVSACTVLVVRHALAQRAEARRYRAIFITAASDLIGKPEFPDEHAKQLTVYASIWAGWLTRALVLSTFWRIISGRALTRTRTGYDMNNIPEHLRPKFAVAVLALAVGDSYRSAFFGPIWRGTNSWVVDAVREIRPDVNAHATKQVIRQVSQSHAPKWSADQLIGDRTCVPA
jgi:hypothetical protein